MSIRTAAALIHYNSGNGRWRYSPGSREIQKVWAFGMAARRVLDRPQMCSEAALTPLTLALQLRGFFPAAGAAS